MKQNEQLMTVPIDKMIYRQVRATAALKGLSLCEFVRRVLISEIKREKELSEIELVKDRLKQNA